MSDEKTITPAQWRVFFDALGAANSVSTALRKSGITRGNAYYYKRTDKIINERWQEAIETGVDYLKDAALERAVDGITSTYNVYSRGEIVASRVETKYSDKLLLALLASRDPSFRQTSNDQVQAKVLQELTRVLDLLQRRLPPEIYEMIVEIIATGDEIIDVDATYSPSTARQIESGP